MRKIGSFLLIIMIIVLILINYKASFQMKKELLISQKTQYSIIQRDIFNMNIDLFINQNHIISNKEAIDTIYISDFTKQKKLIVSSYDITKIGSSKFLKDHFIKYQYSLYFNELHNDFYIEEAYLTINLKNDETFSFLIGSVSFLSMSADEKESHIIITELFGDNSIENPQTLSSVTLSIKPKVGVTIKKIKFNQKDILNYDDFIENTQTYQINLSKNDYVYQSSSIVIEYEYLYNNYQTSIENFLFFDFSPEKDMLGKVNLIYELG